jgi:hypothetical protein
MPRVRSQVYLELATVCHDPFDDPSQGVTEGLPQHRDTSLADGLRPFPRPLSSGGERPHSS